MRRVLLLLSTLAVLATGACAPVAPPGSAGNSGAEPAWVNEMMASINSARAQSGAGPLRWCGTLRWAAQLHSQDQAAHNRLSHTGSNGSSMVQRAVAAGYNGWTGLAENVAAGYPSVSSVMSGWMNSSGHRRNLLNPSYSHVGVGKATSSNGTPYWTQDFGRGGAC